MRTKLLILSLIIVFTAFVFVSLQFEQKFPVTAQTGNTVKKDTPVTDQKQNADLPETKKESSNSAVLRPNIISRQAWNAKKSVGTIKEHTIRYITIHHTATLQKKDTPIEKKLQNLQNFSQTASRLATSKMKPVWFDVPYHYYIAADGKIAEGREIKFVGDTNTDYDPTGHALVVVEGNFETEQPSAAQQRSLQDLVAWLAAKYEVATTEIKAHNDYASTACPGKNLKTLLPTFREKISEIIKLSENSQ